MWCWRRWIQPDRHKSWIDRLQARGFENWALTTKPERVRSLLEIYSPRRREAAQLARTLGGQVRRIFEKNWLRPVVAPPLRIGRNLYVVHEENNCLPGQIYIPFGLAFGSGEHATTGLLLRALARRRHWTEVSILDLGTGTGLLALAARHLGARRVAGIDFDPQAIRTAAQNEILNFATPLIRWRRGDVKRLLPGRRYSLVLANLFSGILIESAARIAAAVAPGGELWLSGVLRSQDQEVRAAYRRQKLRLISSVNRGKWMMQQWERRQDEAGVLRKTTHTK